MTLRGYFSSAKLRYRYLFLTNWRSSTLEIWISESLWDSVKIYWLWVSLIQIKTVLCKPWSENTKLLCESHQKHCFALLQNCPEHRHYGSWSTESPWRFLKWDRQSAYSAVVRVVYVFAAVHGTVAYCDCEFRRAPRRYVLKWQWCFLQHGVALDSYR